jgi:hypothetical protein
VRCRPGERCELLTILPLTGVARDQRREGRNAVCFENSPFHCPAERDELVAEHRFGSQDQETDDQRWVQTFWNEVLFLSLDG